MTDINIPKLGDGVEGAEILSILVQVGETISEGQALLELESDKATVEVPSTAAGVVQSIAMAEGDTVSEGQLILRLEAGDSEAVSEKAPEKSAPEKQAPSEKVKEAPAEAVVQEPISQEAPISTLEIVIPKLGDGVDGADVLNILVSEGDTLEKGDALLELESDKATVEVPSEVSGVLKSLRIAVGDTVQEGMVIGIVEAQGKASPQKPTEKSAEKPAEKAVEKQTVATPVATSQVSDQSATTEAPTLGNPVPAAPSVRRFARELGVDIQQVKGTGVRGRISESDVKAHVKTQMQGASGTSTQGMTGAVASALPAMPDFSAFGPIETEKMNGIRRATAQQMSLSWQNIPHVTQFDQADITELEVFRKAQGKVMEKAGAKLTVTAMLLKICAMALKKFPQFNASIDTEAQQIIYKKYYNVGVAVETPRGLMVPVLNDVATKGFVELSVELNTLAQKARDRKIAVEDLQGGTFTITNLGGLGTSYFTPIVNWPQVAILGVGRATLQPVWQEGAFVPRMIMPLSISYDHRLIDGADAARFLRWIALALESPLTMMMESENL